ncbi:MAG TPA: M28 family peptidase [Solirubrobacteraceae bacterium]|nr:M28 family peptidase [Solirubrobacteraceae bacterium]
MRPLETIRALAAFERRGPGTDAERRAARRLAGDLMAQRYRVRIETFWCRPNWALAHAWHVALAVVGSLLSPSHPTAGAILLAIALASILMDEMGGISPGRRLTPERASQNVVVRATAATDTAQATRTRTPLILTANYDAGRTGLVYRDWLRRPAAFLRNVAGRLAVGWLGCVCIAIAWLLAVAVLRATDHHGSTALGVIQLPPTVVLVLGLALLLEAAAAPYGPAANDNASGAAVAAALVDALATNPPDNLDLELVLAGAGEGGEIGIRRYLRKRRRELRRARAIVLGVAPCGSGDVHYWVSDGPLIPLGYARRLRKLAATQQKAAPMRSRGATPAFPARARGLAAIAIGCLDAHGLAPRSHQPTDSEATIDEATLERTVEFATFLTTAINASLASAEPLATPA